MAVIKKKTLKKNSLKKKKQSFRMRASYVVIPSLLIGLLISLNLPASTARNTAVLGANISSSQQSFFSFSNFFNSILSLFTGKSPVLNVPNVSNTSSFGNNSKSLNPSSFPQPPQAAFSACSGKTVGINCSFTAPRGTVTGTCQTPPGQSSLVCAPTTSEQNQGNPLYPN